MQTLADDLIEPFRPVVDRLVLDLLATGSSELGPAEKARLAAVLEEKAGDGDVTVRTSLERLCQNFALYVEGERESLSVPVYSLEADGSAEVEDG